MITKNQVKTRADLALEGTLSSIVTCKVNQFFEEPCYEFKPSKEMLQKAKKSASVYNKAYTKLGASLLSHPTFVKYTIGIQISDK